MIPSGAAGYYLTRDSGIRFKCVAHYVKVVAALEGLIVFQSCLKLAVRHMRGCGGCVGGVQL